MLPGPRADWFAEDALERLCAAAYVVGEDSNRVGLRLDGDRARAGRDDELPSEGMVLGAVQVPPGGQPVVLLADHPPTGGYPVLAVVHPDDLWQCAQLRPGEQLRFVRSEVLDELGRHLDRPEPHPLVDRDHVVVGLGVLRGDQREVGAGRPGRRGG